MKLKPKGLVSIEKRRRKRRGIGIETFNELSEPKKQQ